MSTKIKICGVRDPEIAKQAVDLGAQYIGILCYTGSKRYVTPDVGKKIAEATLLAGGVPVAICVDADAETMLALCEQMSITTVQLSGKVSRQSHAQLPDYIRRIYTLHVNDNGVIQPDVDRGVEQLDIDRDQLMFDGVESGSGHTFNLAGFDNPYSMPFFLAGGLTAVNVAGIIDIVHPDVVDVSSGVESAPGVKDIGKIEAFIQAVRESDS